VRIALVRHGQTEWNRLGRLQGRTGAPLDEVGHEQAALAARLLAGSSWHWLQVSPAQRALETADAIAASIPGIAIHREPALIERDYGQAEGIILTHAQSRWPDGIPGMETEEQLAERGAAALRRIAEERADADGIVVGHGAYFRAALALLSGTSVPRILNGSITTVDVAANRWRILSINAIDASV
jgi:uncharacterized phosphatase